MSSNDDHNLFNDVDQSGHSTPKLSCPIDIPGSKSSDLSRELNNSNSRRRARRRRAPSDASSLSSHSSFSRDSPSPTTPSSAEQSSGEAGTSPVDSATSPLVSYFLSHASPTSTAANFSFKNRRKTVNGIFPTFEEREEEAPELPHVLHHARRLSSSWAQGGTIGVQQKGPVTGSQQERHTSLMRRLSLGGGTQRPTFPAQNTLEPIPQRAPVTMSTSFIEQRPSTPRATPRRSATISSGPRHRPPSPMGERMLKGHFDGF